MPIRPTREDFVRMRTCPKCKKETFADEKDCVHCTKQQPRQTDLAEFEK